MCSCLQGCRENHAILEGKSLHSPIEVPVLSTSPNMAKSQFCLRKWGMKPTVLGYRNSADLHTVALPRWKLYPAAVRRGYSSNGCLPNKVEFIPH